jgi:hypothetical protein
MTPRRTIIAAVTVGLLLAVLATPAVATPTPTPSPSNPATQLPWLPSTPGAGGVDGWIINLINTWFTNLVALGLEPLLNMLGATLLATPQVTGSQRVLDLWQTSLAIADSAFVLLAGIGGILAMTYQSVQTRYAVKEILPRLVVAVFAANTSFVICGQIIQIANAVAGALLGSDTDPKRAAVTLRAMILPPSNTQIFFNLLALVGVVLLILLLISFLMRSTLILFLVVVAPLALACHALPAIDQLARLWWRAFTGLLIVQIAQSLTLVLAVRIFFNQDGHLLLGIAPTGQLINLLITLVLLIILVKIPSWASRYVWAHSSGNPVTRIVKYAVAYKMAAPLLNAMHLGRGGRSPAPPAARAGVGRAAAGGAGRVMASRAIAGTAAGPAGAAASAVAGTTAATSGRGVQAAAQATGVQAAGRQPRWQAPRQRWMPPDTHAPASWSSPASTQASQRWSNPRQRWAPLDAPTLSTARTPRTPPPTAWVPPDHRPIPPPSSPARSPSSGIRGRGRKDQRGGHP